MSKVNGHDPRSEAASAVSAPPNVTATDALDVGEQIRRLQALGQLRAAGILTDAELTDLKRRVLSSGSDAPPQARRAGVTDTPQIGDLRNAEAAFGPTLDRREPRGTYVTTLAVVGTIPIDLSGRRQQAALLREVEECP